MNDYMSNSQDTNSDDGFISLSSLTDDEDEDDNPVSITKLSRSQFWRL